MSLSSYGASLVRKLGLDCLYSALLNLWTRALAPILALASACGAR
ncbi:hypothetical protein [Azotobacter beijerinckii]|nr:hypothetical protein [Azotobacter beijerinckii]MDV7213630.1 hypothetical protein [Azotobacter beijerinckii]